MNANFDKVGIKHKLSEKTVVLSDSGCWIWMGAISPNGYGSIRIKQKTHSTHRVSYQVHKGEIPNGASVLHSCDVRCCINPDHLRVGTYADNQHDRLIRIRHHRTKLSVNDVRAIRSMPEKQASEVAEMFSTTTAAIYQIRNNSSWAWI
jgi:hypothetical protein